MSAQAVSNLTRSSLLRPTAVNSILAEVRSLQSAGRELVSLMRGEPDLRTPEHIAEAAVRAVKAGRTSYPDNRGELSLRKAVAGKLQRQNGLSYDPQSEILITDGATFGIYAALMALAGPGDIVMLPDPVYDAYQSPVRLAGAEVRPVKSDISGGRFQLTADALEAAWTPGAKVLLLNTPWNPTGTVFTRAELEAVAGFVVRRNLTLISDEIYEAITYDPHTHISPASLSEEIRKRCLLVNSFSKTYAMTGWRLGYCAGPKQILDSMFLILQQSSRGPATFIQDAGVAALTDSQDCVRQMQNTYAERRSAVLDALRDIPSVRVIAPEGGFFAMLDMRERGLPSNEVRTRLLREHGVIVVHGSAYGEGGEGTLRVSFASGGNVLSRGLEKLRAGLLSI
jgi:aspartate aminotransferase